MDNIIVTYKRDYAIVQLNRGKVNAMEQKLVDELRVTIKEMENNDDVKGVIISGQPHYYSAGLDVIKLYNYNESEIGPFFTSFGQMYIELARFSKPLIGAITGHAPAGGCVIAITCDYRVMPDDPKYKIGLNEILVNVPLSQDLIDGYTFWLGAGLAHRYLLSGKMMSPQEAYDIGFVDELCPLDEVLSRAEKQMQEYLNADTRIFKSIKYKTRKSWIDNMGANPTAALKENLDIWWSPSVRARIKMFAEMLSNKNK